MQIPANDRPTFDAQDDFLRVTGQANAHHLARFLATAQPGTFAWEEGRETRRYARSLLSDGGISLAYGRRNQDGYSAPQSDTRDSRDFCLEVPGHHCRKLLPLLREYPDAKTMQCPRRDVAITLGFDPSDCSQIYRTWSDLLQDQIGHPAHRIGPDGNDWESISLQTHVKQANAPRFAILYDKHAQAPAQFTDPGTLRFEFRFTPDKQPQKRKVFEAEPMALLLSWRLSRKALELLLNAPQPRTFAWTEPKPDADLETMTLRLLHSYGPTIFRGISQKDSAGYLTTLALASLLQANEVTQADNGAQEPVCPEAAQVAILGNATTKQEATGYH